MWIAMSSGGELTQDEFIAEINQNKICPVLFYSSNGIRKVPLFVSPHVACDFAKRNTPKEDSFGVMEIGDKERQVLLNSGFEFEELEWPCKREISVHVLFLDCEVETIVNGNRKN